MRSGSKFLDSTSGLITKPRTCKKLVIRFQQIVRVLRALVGFFFLPSPSLPTRHWFLPCIFEKNDSPRPPTQIEQAARSSGRAARSNLARSAKLLDSDSRDNILVHFPVRNEFDAAHRRRQCVTAAAS